MVIGSATIGSRPAPFCVPVRFQGKTELILIDQLRTLDAARLVTRLGRVDARTLAAALRVLGKMIGR